MLRSVPSLAAFTLVLLLCGAAAAEDTITVKGDTLRGKVAAVDGSGVHFEPVYGDGAITVPWADVEAIETDHELTVLYGDKGEVRGRLLGLGPEGGLLVGADAASATAIPTGDVFGSLDGEGSELRSRFRHWRASFDAGGSFTDATTDRASGSIGLRLDYDREPFHWLLEAVGRYSSEKSDDAGSSVTENTQYLFTRGEYDLTDRLFNFASLRLTRDTIQRLSLRTEPKAGLGYRIFDREKLKLAVDIGGAYVHEDFFGHNSGPNATPPAGPSSGTTNSYWAVAFGANSEVQLPYGAVWRARAEYVPAVDEWADDYLLRGYTELDFPLLGWLAFVVSLEDEYDSTPAPGTQYNRFTTTGSLRARFP